MKRLASTYLLVALAACGIVEAQDGYVVWARNSQIWRMRPNGAGKTQLTEAYARHPNICPKARKVIYDYTAASTDPTDIWIMDRAGQNKTNLTSTASTEEVRPDCGQDNLDYGGPTEFIAFANKTDGNIYTTTLTGGPPTLEANSGDEEADPAWCWNSGIAFVKPFPTSFRVFTWNTDTDQPTQRTVDTGTGPPSYHAEHRFPTCSKNGQFLIYERQQFLGSTVNQSDTYRVDGVDVGGPPAQGVSLTDCYGNQSFYYAADYPDLSPGDSAIVFRYSSWSGFDGDYEIAKAPANQCDDSGLAPESPQYLTGCAPDGHGSPDCGAPGAEPDNSDVDTDPDWGEM